jgi:hypothetical protein
MSAKIPDQDGIKLLLKGVGDRLPRLSQLWVDAGYQGRGKEWAEEVLGLKRRGRSSHFQANPRENRDEVG